MNSEHISREFDVELQDLRKRLLAMGSLCEAATTMAFKAFWEGRPELAADVPRIEAQLDRDEVDIEALALRIIALRQPVAGDLRFLAASLRLVTDLERIGDAATDITKCIFADRDTARSLAGGELHHMDRTAQAMLRDALQAFFERDPAMAKAVLLRDDDVDRRCTQVIGGMTAYIAAHPEDVEGGLRVMWVAKYLERVADHATNVAEEVIFMVRGEDIRHAIPPVGAGAKPSPRPG